ncbi:cation diffusion facilitator family transporter [Demequina capsici]|uniref:Cation diffusion facilitator family transporter n=2 Tax=Demequina capsici TaxID=3075620 RepID=A0AA96JBW7_9MICO|nr:MULTISPECIES: cation diffusion facilitator family transporter [unclassified Demequina]WNM25965.1 cation diffusion facilitator family transporter [Demequina sp. OYTSA14]WNM28845.1 cation diffusion facilitator family transporter [Demequina sp. PMTSA13]
MLVAAFMAVEVIVALSSGSLSLMSDAGHMAADVVTLGAALVATRIAGRSDTSGSRTYGSYRAEVFASGLAALVMLAVAVYVVVEAIRRAGTEPTIPAAPMLVVGGLGLIVNVVSLMLLRAGSRESLNVRGAYLEVIADAAGSVGVILAATLMITTGSPAWDVVVALAIGAFVAVRAVLLAREVLDVLGQHAPRGFDVDAAAHDLAALAGVRGVHDLHAWTLTSGMNVATAHLLLEHGADPSSTLVVAQAVLRDEHGIAHATLQLEDQMSAQCHDVSW